jgi:hypothetical protein
MLKIHEDFKNLIPPLNADEFHQLEQNILEENRCRNAIKTWRGFIIDGHNRHAICTKHNIPFDTQSLKFSSETEAKIWIAENQLGRRNLTHAMRIETAAKKLEFLRERAKENLSAAGGSQYTPAPDPVNMRKAIAQTAGVSEQTVQRYMKIAGSGAKDLIQKVQTGEIKIGTAYNAIKNLHIYEKTSRKLFTPTPKERATIQIKFLEAFCETLTFTDFTTFNDDDHNKLKRSFKKQLKVITDILRTRP